MSQKSVKDIYFLKKWGVFCISLSLFMLLGYVIFVGGIDNVKFPTKHAESSSIKVILLTFLAAITIVPVVEEFMFRGVFLKNKIISLLALISSILFIVSVEPIAFTYFLLIPYLIIYLILFFKKNYCSKSIFVGFLILNACLFELLHKDSVDFEYFLTYPLFLLGIGFVFIVQWFVLNYNIFYSMLFHSAWNGTLVFAVLVGLQIPNETLHVSENEKLQVEWKEAPLISAQKFTNEDTIIRFESYLVRDLFSASKDSISEGIKNKFIQKETDQRYDFTITIKDSTIDNSKLVAEFYSILKDEDLIIEK